MTGAYFATHRGTASVITTADSGSYAPLTAYEYLAYTIVVQSVLLHLDMNGGLPADAFAPRSSSTGDVFQFAPDRATLKSTILAAKLSPEEESLIFNRFGPEYLGVCANLISLDWLYSARVRTNLSKGLRGELVPVRLRRPGEKSFDQQGGGEEGRDTNVIKKRDLQFTNGAAESTKTKRRGSDG